jgi:hypothetical protein
MKSTITLINTFLISSLLLTSCVQKSEQSKTPTKKETELETVTPEKPEITIEEPTPDAPPTVDVAVYVEYPDDIDGCACYFGRNESELSDAKYVFMTNYEKKAYMKLDGAMRTFELISGADLEDGRLMETWKNENYDMIVTSKETGQIDETWQSIGTINIKPKDKEATTIEVVGECGC